MTKATKELRSAANRTLGIATLSEYAGKTFPGGAFEVFDVKTDAEALARYVLETVPADDGEPVTDWLRSVGFFVVPNTVDEWSLTTKFFTLCLTLYSDDTFAVNLLDEKDDSDIHLGNYNCRGDIRRLASALGIPLKATGAP